MATPPPVAPQSSGTEWLTVNCGGTAFVTTTTTLRGGCDYFQQALSESWNGGAGQQREHFLDVDADAFRCVLSYLRSGCAVLPEDEPLGDRVVRLARFLHAPGLLAEFEQTRRRATMIKRLTRRVAWLELKIGAVDADQNDPDSGDSGEESDDREMTMGEFLRRDAEQKEARLGSLRKTLLAKQAKLRAVEAIQSRYSDAQAGSHRPRPRSPLLACCLLP